MSAIAVHSTDLTLIAPCGCSMRRAGPVDPETGAIQGETSMQPCRLHDTTLDLLATCEVLFNRWSNTRPGSPHRILDDNDAIMLKAVIDKAGRA